MMMMTRTESSKTTDKNLQQRKQRSIFSFFPIIKALLHALKTGQRKYYQRRRSRRRRITKSPHSLTFFIQICVGIPYPFWHIETTLRFDNFYSNWYFPIKFDEKYFYFYGRRNFHLLCFYFCFVVLLFYRSLTRLFRKCVGVFVVCLVIKHFLLLL